MPTLPSPVQRVHPIMCYLEGKPPSLPPSSRSRTMSGSTGEMRPGVCSQTGQSPPPPTTEGLIRRVFTASFHPRSVSGFCVVLHKGSSLCFHCLTLLPNLLHFSIFFFFSFPLSARLHLPSQPLELLTAFFRPSGTHMTMEKGKSSRWASHQGQSERRGNTEDTGGGGTEILEGRDAVFFSFIYTFRNFGFDREDVFHS